MNFDAYYEGTLKPILLPLEAKRVRSKKLLLLAGGLFALGLVLLLLSFLPSLMPESSVAGVLMSFSMLGAALIFGAILFLIGSLIYIKFTYYTEFKEKVVGAIARFVDEDMEYKPEDHITTTDFRASQLISENVDLCKGEDYFSGTHGKTAFKFSEVEALAVSKGSGKETRYQTLFKGAFFLADFNKEFQGLTVVLPDRAEKIMGAFGRKVQETIRHSGEFVKLEDPEFEKEFVVYSNDQIEARYILSPSLMQNLLDFKARTQSTVRISFHQSTVYMAISGGGNRFEPPIMKSVLDPQRCKEYLEDVEFFFQIIDDLNLNTRIWTKE